MTAPALQPSSASVDSQRVEPARPNSQRWTLDRVLELFALPFPDLLQRAHETHRLHFDAKKVQVSTLLSIKTGGCSEDCKYCSQSARYDTGLQYESLMPLDQVVDAARNAKRSGASRFCMGAAWKSPKDRDMDKIVAMVKAVKETGIETCLTLGMLTETQTAELKAAGLDYYNHNVDTSEEYYGEIVTTHTLEDRLDTLAKVRATGIKLCTGGILGLGESHADRASMLMMLANLPEPPESVPINRLVPIPGTPLADSSGVDSIDFVRAIAVARILMPKSYVRLSAGRESMSAEMQALCFYAGANSIFSGEKLLTTPNAGPEADSRLFAKLGLERE